MRVRFIVNPKSGRENSAAKIEKIIKYLFEDRHEVSMRFTNGKDDAKKFAIEAHNDEIDRLVVVGGDGTVNETVCGLVECMSKIPLTIIPGGTTNDFANYMGLVKNEWETYKAIVGDNTELVDCGKVGDRYFMNVGACGAFTDVAHNTPTSLKATFGRAAYVMKAISEINVENLTPRVIRFESDNFVDEIECFLVLVSNSKCVGGYNKMLPMASVKDGLLDVLIVQNMPIPELITTFVRIRSGEHINHPKVIYFKTKKISLSSNANVELDVDGEYFGHLPATFEVVEDAVKLSV